MGKGKSEKTYTITESQLNKTIQKAVTTGMETGVQISKKTAEEKAGVMLYRTRVLLENYRYLHNYESKAVCSVKQMEEEQTAPESDADLDMLVRFGLLEADTKLYRMKKGVTTTKLLLDHTDRMLDVYKADCETSPSEVKKRQWRVIYNLYLADQRKSQKEVAEMENEDNRAVRRDAENAIKDLTALIFGLDGLLIRILDI